MSKEKIEHIKEQLSKELGKKSVDFGRINSLAADLSALDTESAAFSVNATIIRRLGRELVAAQETALAELVKNAFDADAKLAEVIFSSTDKPGGRLLIKDDGNGMTPQQLRDGFLRIASDSKEIEPASPTYKRRRAGQKGIGRFAVERLGARLVVVTATESDPLATELNVEWNAFEKSAELFSLRHPIKRVPKTFSKGTTLIIDGLRESWSLDAIQEAEAYVGDLTEPGYFASVLPESEGTPKLKGDPGFKVQFSIIDGVMPKPIARAEAEVVNSAAALVDATVRHDGTWEVKITSRALRYSRTFVLRDIGKDEKALWKFTSLREVRVRAAYVISDADYLQGLKAGRLKKILRTRGGIKIYRNGFRVPPYGNPDNDWLSLDRMEAGRAILVPVKSSNWLGFVSIADPGHKRAIETSSREGLVMNEFLAELTQFAKNSLVLAAIEIGRLRKKKIYASDPDFGQAKSERALKAANTLSKYLADLQKTRKGSAGYAKEALTDSALADIKVELEKLVKDASDLTGEVAILRVFASVGMSVLMFSHEVKNLLGSMLGQIDDLAEDDDIPARTKKRLKELRSMLGRLQHLTGFYEATGSAAADRTVSGVDALSLVNSFVESFAPQAAKRGIALKFEGDATLPVRAVSMHEAELSSVLINLYTNAVKAIDRHGGTKAHEIIMRHSRVGDSEVIEVLDTGAGIKAADKESIFKPFFTTTPVKRALRPGDPEMFGTGLGLTIARDAIRGARGNIEVVLPPPRGYSSCLRIELPHIPDDPKEQSAIPVR